VLGPLSEWNSTVRLYGQLVGAKISVYCGTDQVIASATATRADEIYALDAGKHFQAGKLVTATQDVGPSGGGASKPSATKVTVQSAPQHLGHLVFASPVYQCGDAVALTGATPGATVHVGVLSGATFHQRGSAPSPDGTADVILNPSTAATDVLVAHQTGGTLHGPNTTGPATIPVTKSVPTPKIQGPLTECETVVMVSNIIEGSVVSLTRSSDGTTVSGTYVVSLVPIYLQKPLVKGETITVQQELMAPCGYPSPPATATVLALTAPPTPALVGPICPNGGVVIEKLITGAPVRLLADGTSLGEAEAWASTIHLKPHSALTAGAEITAEQQVCTKWSAPSNAIKVGSTPAPGTLTIDEPVTGCASSVHVENCQPGSAVQIVSSAHGEIGQGFPLGTTVDVEVAPLLTAGDKIHAHMSGCGAVVNSAAVKVAAPPKDLKPPGSSGRSKARRRSRSTASPRALGLTSTSTNCPA
jgi:hypothetical protein